MKKLYLSTILAVLLGFATLANATLINNGGGLLYDTELNITWYDFTYTGPQASGYGVNWADALAWAAGLTVGGVSGWTLPTSNSCIGYDCTGSQMGHLFYTELSLAAGQSLSSTNQSPFTSLLAALYLSGTEYDATGVWGFTFDGGFQDSQSKNANGYAMAVHTGNVGAPVPIPAAFWLLCSGLIGLIGFRRFRK